MTQKKKMSKKHLLVIVGLVCVAIIAGVSLGVMTYFSDADKPAAQDTFVPTLVTSNMHFYDNRSDPNKPFLQVTGVISNTGNGTANNCTLHMTAIQNGNDTAINQTVNLESIAAGATQNIDLDFNYTGTAIVAYNSPTLDWTN